MKLKIATTLILLILSLSLNTAYAIPPPCTPEQLLSTSEYAVEGRVLKVVCGEPYDSSECIPEYDENGVFEAESFSNCAAKLKITKNLKGEHKAGEKVQIPFVRVARACKGGTHIIPGSPTYDLTPDTDIRYYKSEQCKYWNIEQIPEPGLVRNSEPGLTESEV